MASAWDDLGSLTATNSSVTPILFTPFTFSSLGKESLSPSRGRFAQVQVCDHKYFIIVMLGISVKDQAIPWWYRGPLGEFG